MSTGEPTQKVESTTTGNNVQYHVTITVNEQTLSALMAGNYHLYGFRAVRGSQGGAAPLVWFETRKYLNNTMISWEEGYQAYIAMSPIMPDARITPAFVADITLGQTLQVQADGMGGQVVNGGPSTAISIFNQTSRELTCGITSNFEGSASPICAFPLYGNQMDTITPLDQVLLMFSTRHLSPGTVIGVSTGELQEEVSTAYTPAIMIDLTTSNERSANFDINAGWEWGGYSWARQVAANENIVPLLIQG